MALQQVMVMGLPGKRSVDQASGIIKKLYFIERELMRTVGGYHVNISNWELKKKLPKHIWQDSLRADALRSRVLEMRYPRRDVDQGHEPKLESYLAHLIRCENDAELLVGVYFVTKQALIALYEDYLKEADPVEDAPTIALMKRFPEEIRNQINEISKLYVQLPENALPGAHQEWQNGLQAFLMNIGGLLADQGGNGHIPAGIAGRKEYVPPLTPKRDPKFTPAVYHMPSGSNNLDAKFIERQVWYGISHVNEMWAAEIPNLVIWKWNDMPWDFYLDCTRWAYDESRHSMMGEERLKSWGFEIGVDYPVVADHYISVSGQGELAVLALLHAFEIYAPQFKAQFKSEFEAEGDTASSQDFDYDWADESIHLQYGHKWVLHRLNGDLEAFEDLKEEMLKEEWGNWIKEKHLEWDYEPFKSRISKKIAEVEEGRYG